MRKASSLKEENTDGKSRWGGGGAIDASKKGTRENSRLTGHTSFGRLLYYPSNTPIRSRRVSASTLQLYLFAAHAPGD